MDLHKQSDDITHLSFSMFYNVKHKFFLSKLKYGVDGRQLSVSQFNSNFHYPIRKPQFGQCKSQSF